MDAIDTHLLEHAILVVMRHQFLSGALRSQEMVASRALPTTLDLVLVIDRALREEMMDTAVIMVDHLTSRNMVHTASSSNK